MKYCQVYLRGIKGIFTWETDLDVVEGSLVVVKFRNGKRTGVIVGIETVPPEFKTEKILEVWEKDFFPASYITSAKEISEANFCGVEKILSLMIPEKFHRMKDPVLRDVWYELTEGAELESLRGTKQKDLVALMKNEERRKKSEIELKKQFSLQTIRGLVEKEILIRTVGNIQQNAKSKPRRDASLTELFSLTEKQQEAFDAIKKSKKPSLLFGVTGSGKTEVYKYLMNDALDEIEQFQNGQILFLVPEIALTPQLITNLQGTFGSQIALWHSNLSEGEKIQEWGRIVSGEARILVGTRSAVLVPIPNLKLIVMDEEHEWTYKNEFVPRFWTHDVVEQLAKKFDAKIVLGTATPRVESLYRCDKKAWDLVKLNERVFAQKMPDIQTIDLQNEAKKGNYDPISERLAKALKKTIEQGRQAVLFLNKRGYAGSTMCRHCGDTFECPHCSHPMKAHFGGRVQDLHNSKSEKNDSFAFHKAPTAKLICHVCGYLEGFPEKCSACNKKDFNFRGWGTQQVESHLKEILPDLRVLRADRDSVGGRYDFERILKKFENHEADVLLGTQMIAKGLDLEKVDLVGIVMADVGLNLPDFRAEERVFQLLMQVSGRAGRRKKQGNILIQTYSPEAPIFEYIRTHDVAGFLEEQLQHRIDAGFGPDQQILKITISHEQKEVSWMEGKRMYEVLRKDNLEYKKELDIFFAPAFFPRSHGRYHFHVVLKASKQSFLQLQEQVLTLNKNSSYKSKITLDCNPASLL